MANFLSNYTGAELEEAIKITQNLAEVATSGKYGDLKDKPIYCDTTENWYKKPDFIGNKGDLIIFSDYKISKDGKTIAGIKISDGLAYILDRPFITEFIEEEIDSHIQNMTVHITQEERIKWNNKITTDDEVINENLVLSRN